MKLNMIVCVAKDNLIGDKNPTGNGLLWHSKDDLQFFKKTTLGSILLFGANTAKVVPINLFKKTRDVVVVNSKEECHKAIEKYKNTDKTVFICGGATIYKYFLENFKLDTIYVSKLNDNVVVEKPISPLYFPNVEEYGYKLCEEIPYTDFTACIYKEAK